MKSQQDWIDNAIASAHPVKPEASRSWWVGASRDELAKLAEQEIARMRKSKFGSQGEVFDKGINP